MDLDTYIQQGIDERILIKRDVDLKDKINRLVDELVICFGAGNKVLFAGNGGSAADAQHLAAEFVSRFQFDRPGLPALSLSTDTSAITAIGNDYGFENLFSRQIQALGSQNDVFLGISTSGKSLNILRGLSAALDLGMKAYLFTGNGELEFSEDIRVINVPSTDTCFIQELHITLGHYVCGAVEERIFR